MTAGVARETEKRDLAFHFFRTSFLLQNVFRKFSQKIFADKALFLTGQSYGGRKADGFLVRSKPDPASGLELL